MLKRSISKDAFVFRQRQFLRKRLLYWETGWVGEQLIDDLIEFCRPPPLLWNGTAFWWLLVQGWDWHFETSQAHSYLFPGTDGWSQLDSEQMELLIAVIDIRTFCIKWNESLLWILSRELSACQIIHNIWQNNVAEFALFRQLARKKYRVIEATMEWFLDREGCCVSASLREIVFPIRVSIQ